MSIYTSQELLKEYTDEFYRLTNKEENHRDFQYKTGTNTDILPFNPTGECSSGGMYFFHKSQIRYVGDYCKDIKWIRKVSFTDKSKIYSEPNKFKTNEFVLGERKEFFLNDWVSEELCKIVLRQNGYVLSFKLRRTM